MKTYYLTLSKSFPKDLPNAGEPTNFENAFFSGQGLQRSCKHNKIHTIRANYEFWRKRFEKIEKGEACLSIRQWVGKPYAKGSIQREICRLTNKQGIGIQKIEIVRATKDLFMVYIDGKLIESNKINSIANNDGLDFSDWFNWFAGYDLNKPMAIIHFTKFRYR